MRGSRVTNLFSGRKRQAAALFAVEVVVFALVAFMGNSDARPDRGVAQQNSPEYSGLQGERTTDDSGTDSAATLPVDVTTTAGTDPTVAANGNAGGETLGNAGTPGTPVSSGTPGGAGSDGTNTSPAPKTNTATKPRAADPTTPPPATTSPAGWKLAWSDEFNDSQIDNKKWNVRDNATFGRLSYDQAIISKDLVSESGGLLHMKAVRLSTPIPSAERDRWFKTSYLDTRPIKAGDASFSQKYGRWEMRAKIPTTPGVSRGVWGPNFADNRPQPTTLH